MNQICQLNDTEMVALLNQYLNDGTIPREMLSDLLSRAQMMANARLAHNIVQACSECPDTLEELRKLSAVALERAEKRAIESQMDKFSQETAKESK